MQSMQVIRSYLLASLCRGEYNIQYYSINSDLTTKWPHQMIYTGWSRKNCTQFTAPSCCNRLQ